MSFVRKCALLGVLVCLHFSLPGQVLNPGFELLRTDGTIANWESRTVFVFPVDSTSGECPQDSTFFLTNDAHSGNHALESRAVKCHESIVYSTLYASDDIPAFAPSLPCTARPSSLSFFYKFFPVMADGFRVSVYLNDIGGLPVASLDTFIYPPAAVTAYQQMVLPLRYESAVQPERMLLSFGLAAADGTTDGLHEGSRLLIDDFATSEPTAAKDIRKNHEAFRCYPAITSDQVTLEWPSSAVGQKLSIAIFAADGRLVKTLQKEMPGKELGINVRNMPAGIYGVRIISPAGQYASRFIVSR